MVGRHGRSAAARFLLAGCGLMRCTRDPASRQRVGEIAVVAALLVAVLRCGPVWLNLPWPGSSAIAAEPSPSTLASELSGWIVLTPTTESLSETPPDVETAVALPPPELALELGNDGVRRDRRVFHDRIPAAGPLDPRSMGSRAIASALAAGVRPSPQSLRENGRRRAVAASAARPN